MKKKNKDYKLNSSYSNIRNNRGIAMISILIAVAFVSIIGSALLYITYNNFQMKVLNLQSKENFYETDGELVKITSALRNSITSPSSVMSVAGIGAFVEDPNDPTRKVADYDLTNFIQTSVYTDMSDAGVRNVPNGDSDHTSDTFTYNVKGKVYMAQSGNITTYTFKELGVEQKSGEKRRKDYINDVQTDLEIKILETKSTGGGNKGVGEFSMLMDSSLKVDPNQGQKLAFITFYGDCYFSSYDHSTGFGTFPGLLPPTDTATHDYTKPGKYITDADGKETADSAPALYLTCDSKLNAMGQYIVCFGDVVLDEGSCLYIGDGNLTVYGDIYLNDRSSLICNGSIYMPGDILPGRTKVCGIYGNSSTKRPTQFTGTKIAEHVYLSKPATGKINLGNAVELHPGDSTNAITAVTKENYDSFCDTLQLREVAGAGDYNNDGVANQIIRSVEYYKKDGNPYQLNISKDIEKDTKIPNNLNSTNAIDYYGKETHVLFQRVSGDIHTPNGLIFLMNPGDKEAYTETETTFEYDYSKINDWTTYPWNHPTRIAAQQAQSRGTEEYEAFLASVGWGSYVTNTINHPATKAEAYQIPASILSSTIISVAPLELYCTGIYMTKTSSPLFNYFSKTGKDDTDKPYYNEKAHNFDFHMSQDPWVDNNDSRNKFSAQDFLDPGANTTVSNMLSYGVNGGSGSSKFTNSVSFNGYVKDNK